MTDPLRLVEIAFWALAGVLVSLIAKVPWYNYTYRFYRRGLYLHIGNLAVMPVLAVVIVFLLSQVTITLSVGGSDLPLDFANPFILAPVAFLLGFQPWSTLDFVRDTAGRLLGVPIAGRTRRLKQQPFHSGPTRLSSTASAVPQGCARLGAAEPAQSPGGMPSHQRLGVRQ